MPNNKATLEVGTYEIIRNRLLEQSIELNKRLNALNNERKTIFNAEQFALIANQRITTEHNGIARGIIALEDICIFAYNVHFGLREEIALNDVFSIYQFKDNHFEPLSLELIASDQFETDFKNLYKYYRAAFFSKFYRTPNYLYMIFQTSEEVSDIKAFKWYIDGKTLKYIDDRSIHEVKTAPQYSFNFIKTTLEDRRLGIHPHISILDKIFIEAIGGDITFKIEDNTSTGLGIYAEPVSNKDQQLDDAQYYYADLGNLIAIKIQPYQENFRAYIYNVRTKEVHNIPSLLESGIVLPDEQGIIFSNGYYLQNGTYKLFDNNIEDLEYMRTIAAPNGEDFLYIYYQKKSNTYVLLSYNVIQQEVLTPIICNGFTIFNDGKLIYFRSEQEAIRHHQVQIWQTPYTEALQENEAMKDNVLYKIGNKDIVAAMAETNEILQLIKKEDSFEGLYEDIAKNSQTILDSYFWLSEATTFDLATPIREIASIADTAIDEFTKVQAQRKYAAENLQAKQKELEALAQKIRNANYQTINEIVAQLHDVRLMQGSIIALKEIRYIDDAEVVLLLQKVKQFNEQLSKETRDFFMKSDALSPYEQSILTQKAQIENVTKTIDAQEIEHECLTLATQLELLIDILNSLKIEDTTQTTTIIEQISVLFSALNEVKALLQRKVNTLKSREAVGEFHAQMTLLEQSIINFLDLSDSVDKCDNYQTKLSVHIEDLESKFADFEEFVLKIAEKRDAIIKAFQGKKEMLIAQNNKRTGNLEQIGLRVLKSIAHKAQSFSTTEEIYSFFAADLMIEKIRNLSDELHQLGDVSKAENLTNQLKLSQEQALRNLKDKQELFVDGVNIISLGTYKFTVNTQKLSLTIIPRNGELSYHLLGTNFYQPVKDSEIDIFRNVWNQDYSSENEKVYRSAYLSYQAFQQYIKHPETNIEAFIHKMIEEDYSGGYIKGVHNDDALKIYKSLQNTYEALGILHYAPRVRVDALLYWFSLTNEDKQKFSPYISNAFHTKQLFQQPLAESYAYKIILQNIKQKKTNIDDVYSNTMTKYLLEALVAPQKVVCSSTAYYLKEAFVQHLTQQNNWNIFEQEILKTDWSLRDKWLTIQDWIKGYNALQKNLQNEDHIEEAACILALQHIVLFESKENVAYISVSGLKGSHNTITDGNLSFDYHQFLYTLWHFSTYTTKHFTAFQHKKQQLIQSYEQHLKIQEMQPKPLSSFIRNKLINDVYFPLIGANLAKQIGTVGDDKRTARMGMLLLISPPGYGKTTLMEYLAATMGLHFVKINGPTIGHRIYSIDPSEATTSGARSELKKLNLAFEMEDNVMLYIDDIQHCSPEFLQQFISLADGQRKIDGIFNGVSKTYDLRGKRFCIVMAGNPYTESGTKFKIPDMLANRADVYNLGDVVGSNRQLFELSLIENAIIENAYLQQLVHKNSNDLYALISYVVNSDMNLPELQSNITAAEVQDAIAILKNLLKIRNIVLKVNELYIQSAGMQDAYRVEPAFKLQGSYRNMNKMTNKVVPLMNDKEIEELILSHYESESQTLTADAEFNLLKLKTIMQIASNQELERFEQIVEKFQKNNQFAGITNLDSSSQILIQLTGMNEHFKNLIAAITNNKN